MIHSTNVYGVFLCVGSCSRYWEKKGETFCFHVVYSLAEGNKNQIRYKYIWVGGKGSEDGEVG